MESSGFGLDRIQLTTSSYRRSCKRSSAIAFLVLVLSPLLTIDERAQNSFPAPPNDLTKIYYLSNHDNLLALPFESGATPVNVFQPAIEDKVVRARVTGSKAETVLT